MKNYSAKNVDEYIRSAPKELRPKLKEVRAAIRAALPKAEEKISWGIPFYRYSGPVAGFAALKKHVSFGFGLAGLQEKERKALEKKGYATGKKIIQIQPDQKVPVTAIKQILKAQAKLNEDKSNLKNVK